MRGLNIMGIIINNSFCCLFPFNLDKNFTEKNDSKETMIKMIPDVILA